MRLKSILFFNISLFLFALASILVTVANNDPAGSGLATYITLFVSIFVAFWSGLTLFVYFLKSRAKNETGFHIYLPTIRQTLFLAISMTILLLLQGLRILDWWVGVSVVVAFVLLELFFESRGRQKLNDK